jgi:hypothetical protein
MAWMKVALFTPHNFLASNYALFSYRETLERMGHTVLDCAFPGNLVQDVENVRKKMPSIGELNQCDVVLSTFHEYVQPWIAQVYGFEAWSKLKVPVIARFDESMDRVDLGLPARAPELLRWANFYSFPAAQDAEKYGGQWLPFGADTTIFRSDRWGSVEPRPETQPATFRFREKYDVGFIGTLYPLRKKYLDSLVPHIGKGITFHVGNVIVQDLSGIRERESTELLAENYRQIKVFMCLPPMSRLIVAKTFDIMASGTTVLYPKLLGEAKANMGIFKDQEHIVYYELGYVAENGKQINELIENSSKRERIASAGCKLVHQEYTLEKLLQKLLAPVTKEQREVRDCPNLNL